MTGDSNALSTDKLWNAHSFQYKFNARPSRSDCHGKFHTRLPSGWRQQYSLLAEITLALSQPQSALV